MWKWTYKSLLATPLTLATSILAVSGALLLAMLFDAVYAGEARQVVAYVENADADVWVMQRGVSNMHMATSYLSDAKVNEVQQLDGVADVQAILYLNSVVNAGGKRWFSFVVGLDAGAARAGPWAMSAGQSMPADGEAVVPDVFAEITGIEVGAAIAITDQEFRVVGLSSGTFSMGNTVIFVSKNDLEDIMSALDIVSFLLIKTEPGVDPVALSNAINATVDNVQAVPSADFVENDRGMVMQMGVETIALMTVIGGALAVLLVAFTIYSFVSRLRRELAVIKALGATNRSLLASVGVQAVSVSIAGVILATVLAMTLIPLTGKFLPQVTLSLTLNAIVRTAIASVVIALLASFASARQLIRVDPVSAFQG